MKNLRGQNNLEESTHNPMESKLRFAVTTSHRPTPWQVDLAKQLALEFKAPFSARNDLSLEVLARNLCVEGMVVVSSQKISFVSGEQTFFFHPGLARLRIKALKYGKTDQMIKAMSLKSGESVLDCTLGLGSDAIVASFVAGVEGRVAGVESSPVIFSLVSRGLSNYIEEDEDIALAMRRVEVIHANHKEYLAQLLPSSFDVVYFDPMFRFSRRHSPAMNAMRVLALPNPLDRETIHLALQVAARRVILKERRGSAEFKRLGFDQICGGRYAPVVYGVMDRQGDAK